MNTGYTSTLNLTRSLRFHDAEIAWNVAGRGTPVVLVHGFPWSAQAWRRIVPWLARRHTVYYYDMLGSGRSPVGPASSLDPAVQDELLARLLGHWGLEDPYMVGHDFGGLAVLRGALVRGLRYRGATLIDSVGMLPSGSAFFAHAQRHADAFATAPEHIHAAVFRAYIQSGSARGLSDEVAAMYLEPWSGAAGQEAFYQSIRDSSLRPISEIQDRLGDFAAPTHVVWGREDPIIPLDRGQRLADSVHALSFTAVPGAGHAIQEDAPEAIAALLLEHLDA